MSTTTAPPSAKTMRYAKDLAMQRGVTIGSLKTQAQASAEIKRLKKLPRSSAAERRAERADVSRAMSERGGSSAVRDSEIVGYGSSARWRGSR